MLGYPKRSKVIVRYMQGGRRRKPAIENIRKEGLKRERDL
jgi:hypothetical protein